MNPKRNNPTQLIEAKLLSENLLTHAADAFKLNQILSSGRLKGTVSLSKYPRFSFEGDNGYIAFHRDELEKHLEKKGVDLNRPVYWDTKTTRTGEVAGVKFHSGRRSKSVNFDTSDRASFKNFYQKMKPNKDPAITQRFEPISYSGERELSTKKNVDFEPEHVAYIGHHAILHGDEFNDPKKYALPKQARLYAKEIKNHAYLAATHNKPLKLSVALGPLHKEQPSFTRAGDHEDIQHYKSLLREAMHAEWENDEGKSAEIHKKLLKNYKVDDLVDSMKNSLGSREDTYLLSQKFLHPSLRKSAYEETEHCRPSRLIDTQLADTRSK